MSDPRRPSVLRWVLRPFACLALTSLALHLLVTTRPPSGVDRSAQLARAFEVRRLHVDPNTIYWVHAPPNWLGALRGQRQAAWVRARADQRPHDVFLAWVRLTPEGQVRSVDGVHNLTETAAADEMRLSGAGPFAAWQIGDGDKTLTVQLADLGGRVPPRHWAGTPRVQQLLTNLQDTGLLHGVKRRSFRLDPPASDLTMNIDDRALSLVSQGHPITIPHDADTPTAGGQFVREMTRVVAMPGNLVTWAVDRVRALSWFGDERMQVLKAVAYAGLDVAQRYFGAVWLEPAPEDIEEEFGAPLVIAQPTSAVEDRAWPPAPLTLLLPPAFEREGQWRSLKQDEFVLPNPGLPDAVVTTFLRTDPKRRFSRIYIAAWDPRQVQLHVMTGTEEPKSATGETGTGLIPRDPAVITRLIGAFNGGFQTTHGSFGIKAEDTLFVPPLAYAATIAELRDGSTGFGTWPDGNDDGGAFVGFRQNLTALIANGTKNPYGRVWWGGVPQGWEDDTRTVRSGLCLAKPGHIVYFYGSSVDHEHLAQAMLQASCDYGLHLDMNQGHTGLEFYRVAKSDDLPLIERRLDGVWQEQGDVPLMDGYRFRGRRLIRSMRLMHFPRYIKRQSRDFFYLTLRHLLPGEPLAAGGSDAARWRVADLPQYGFPHVIATGERIPDPKRPHTKVRFAKLDPKYLSVGATTDPRVVVGLSGAPESAKRLWLQGGIARIGTAPPADAEVLAGEERAAPTAAFGIVRTSGMLLYAEIATGRDDALDGDLLTRVLRDAGCTDVLLAQAGTLSLRGTHDLSGHPVGTRPQVLLVRAEGPRALGVFPETPIVPRSVWRPMQDAARPPSAE